MIIVITSRYTILYYINTLLFFRTVLSQKCQKKNNLVLISGLLLYKKPEGGVQDVCTQLSYADKLTEGVSELSADRQGRTPCQEIFWPIKANSFKISPPLITIFLYPLPSSPNFIYFFTYLITFPKINLLPLNSLYTWKNRFFSDQNYNKNLFMGFWSDLDLTWSNFDLT